MTEAMTAGVLLVFLSLAIERTVEMVMAPLPLGGRDARRAVAVAMSLALAAGLCFGLDFDFAASLLSGYDLTAQQAKTITAIALAGGSAPAHELLRLLEEARSRPSQGGGTEIS